jgi:hypothetical protein
MDNEAMGVEAGPLRRTDRALVVFRMASVAAIALVIAEGVAGQTISSYIPLTLPFGGTPLAELGAVLGLAYCTAEFLHRQRNVDPK